MSSSVQTIPAQSCYGNCYHAYAICCGATDDKPRGECGMDRTLKSKCWKELGSCSAKCPHDDADTTTKFTTDFDFNVEGDVVVDEA